MLKLVKKAIALSVVSVMLTASCVPIVDAVELRSNTGNTLYDNTNDGELMYHANFNGDGRYNFEFKDSAGSVDTSAGDSFMLTIGSAGKVTTAGGAISGLTLDSGECYTVDFSIAMEDGSSTHYIFFDPDLRYGFFIRRDKMAIEESGYAFTFENNDQVGYGSSIKTEAFTADGISYNKFNFRVIIDTENEAVRFYYLHKNGNWILTQIGNNFIPDIDELHLYFGAYTANKHAIFSGVNVYKGSQYKAYDDAEDLDLLYKIDFNDKTRFDYKAQSDSITGSVTPSADGSALTIKGDDGKNNFTVGGAVKGLPLDKFSVYTVDFDITMAVNWHTHYMYFSPNTDTGTGSDGFFIRTDQVMCENGFSNRGNGSKVLFTDPATEKVEGGTKLHFRTVVSLKDNTVDFYYLNTSGVWVKAQTGKDFLPAISDLSLYFAIWQYNTDAILSDVSIYKGDLCTDISATDIKITDGKTAVYECDINYQGEAVRVSQGRNELFHLSDSGAYLCGYNVAGNFAKGAYHVKVTVSHSQKMTAVEVKQPDGGIVRRGVYSMVTTSERITVSSADSSCVSNAGVTYRDATENDYVISSDEPQYEGFSANVYNIVTSFTDARYDRAFAWTALDSFIGSEEMAVRYREQGGEWKTVTAVKEALSASNSFEAYFKADVTGLKADTSYEYQIGKKDSTDHSNDWSKTYTFKTAEKNTESFTFVLTGDNQSESWGGRKKTTKGGYMYTQAVINEAVENENPAFIVNVGDMVESGTPTVVDQWNWFFKAMGEHLATIPHFSTLGNHGVIAPEYFDAHFNHPNNGGSAAVDGAAMLSNGVRAEVVNYLAETIYSFDYGDVHFIVLNSGANNSGGTNAEYIATMNAQRSWLISDLEANSDAEWTVLITHQNVYDKSTGSSYVPWLSNTIEEYGVDLVFQGHQHYVARSYPMKNGEIVDKTSPDIVTKGTGTIYVTIGSTTYNKETFCPNPEMLLNVSLPYSEQPTYTSVEVDDGEITVVIRQLNGFEIDRFTLVNTTASDDGNTDDTTDTEVETETETEVDTEVESETEVETDIEADTEVEIEVDTEVDTETDTEVETETDTEADNETEADTETDLPITDEPDDPSDKTVIVIVAIAVIGVAAAVGIVLFIKKKKIS